MAEPTLLDRHLLFVAGKGGAGKSTITAALALLAARAGKRVLVCEVNAPQPRIAILLGGEPSPTSTPRETRPGIHVLNVTPPDAMHEYGLMVLRFRAVTHAVFENRLVRYFLRAIPSLAELVVLGKILHEARATAPKGGPRWDLVLVDAPATGHAVQLLRVPSALLDAVPAGPLRHDVEWMERLLVDPVRTAVALVTLPEETPANEAIELDAQVRGVLGMARAGLFVNAMPGSRLSPAEVAALSASREAAAQPGPPGLLCSAIRAAELASLRAVEGQRHLARLREALDLPTTVVPLLPAAGWGPREIEAVADAVARAWREEAA